MLEYREISFDRLKTLAELYVETFNSEPWNDKWTIETAEKRIHQMINTEDFIGVSVYQDDELCGMILGNKEQFYDGIMFNLKEFCVRNGKRGQGIGSEIFEEFQNRLKKDGIKEIILFTARGEHTEHFYRKHGLDIYNNLIIMGKQI